MDLHPLKVNFAWLGLVGLGMGVTLLNPESLLVRGAVGTESVILLGPGLVLEGILVRAGLTGAVGDTRP